MIRSVDANGIRIGEELYTATIALTGNVVEADWTDKVISRLGEDDFSALLDAEPEVIVLGTGRSNIFPPRELVFAMARRRVGFEAMDTAAAARTYNVLAGEGRQVAAVLYFDHS
jgi:uncharacterized protein